MRRQSLLSKFLIWRVKHINDRNFIMILAVIVGILAGFSAVIIKNIVHFIQSLVVQGFTHQYENYLYFAYPMIGIALTMLFIKYINKNPVGHGIPSVLYAISKENGHIKPHNNYSSIITSALTVGFGGSVGLEGPTVATGAAMGSNLGRALHLNYKNVILLLGCASTGAMAAIFKAPIAGIIFGLEVIMLDLTMSSLVPLLLASTSAVVISYLFLGMNVLYPFEVETSFSISDIPYYLILGVLAGFISLYFTRVYMYVQKIFDKMKNWKIRIIIGGVALGILIFFLPSLYGEGYDAINLSLNGEYDYLFTNSIFYTFRENMLMIFVMIILVMGFKVVATSITFGAGGIGGIFAPTLFMGTNTGLLFGLILRYFDIQAINNSNLAFAGMGGLIAGVLHAPLTAIFLIAEITGGYELFIPLMITGTISYATIKMFEPNSVYTIQLAERGHLITHHKDKAVLSLMKVDRLIETNFNPIGPEASLGDLVNVVSESHRNIFPVIDKDQKFYGIVSMDDIRDIMFKPELYDKTYVKNLMFMPSTWVDPDESMEKVAQKFHDTGNYNLPVIKNGKYKGFVSRANVFSSYRKMLKYFSED
ncbi:MAG: chloride channel protein [Bacteroidales bacterium]|nr:chloride channel protein [Bacteroidales bacterium]